MIRWDEPIEAVHEDGRVSRGVKFEGYDPSYIGRVMCWLSSEFRTLFKMDGTPVYPDCGWRIRNVVQAPETPHPSPSPSEVGPEVVLTAEQAEMLRKTLAGIGACVGTTIGHQTVFVPAHLVSEARDALALLPEPVDPNEQYARDLIREQGWQHERAIGSESVVRMIAMARRALAAGDR